MSIPRIGAEQSSFAGTVVGERYELRSQLGRGSFGRTFSALDRQSGKVVAVKVLDPRSLAGPDAWKAHELFAREAEVLRALRHQGVPEVHEVVAGEWRGEAASFLVMELVDGSSLLESIERREQLDSGRVGELFVEMLGILDYIHSRVPPILHRDIKPANIIVRTSGTPALVDFGSVRREWLAPDEAGSTVAGTYGYMPYEQYMGQASASSDLYALAATFLHLLTGRPPRDFMSEEGRIVVPTSLHADRMRPILERMLRPSPADRYASAREVRLAFLGDDAAPKPRTSVARYRAEAMNLAPGPRTITGDVKAMFERTVPTTWDLLDSSSMPSKSIGLLDWGSLIFFSAVTAGILPLVYISMARARRRRLRLFFERGTPAEAEILSIEQDKLPFDGRISRVTYQFEVNGQTRRGVDQVLPIFATRWTPGDRIQILYVDDDILDSTIISTR